MPDAAAVSGFVASANQGTEPGFSRSPKQMDFFLPQIAESCTRLGIGYSDPKTRGNCEAGQSTGFQDWPSMAEPDWLPEMFDGGVTRVPKTRRSTDFRGFEL